MDRLIYLVRHGETEWNRAGRMQGQRDSPLTTRGEDQARRVGLALARPIGAGDCGSHKCRRNPSIPACAG